MIPERNGRRVMETLCQVTIRSVVLLAEDKQQPIENVSMKVRGEESIFG